MQDRHSCFNAILHIASYVLIGDLEFLVYHHAYDKCLRVGAAASTVLMSSHKISAYPNHLPFGVYFTSKVYS